MTRSQEISLRRLAQQRIESGELPCDPSARMWGGQGSGAACAVCGRPIGADEIEYEVEMRVSAVSGTLHFHRLCHSVWHTQCEAAMAR